MRRRGTSGGRGGASTPTKDGASNAGDGVTRGPSDGRWSTLALVLVVDNVDKSELKITDLPNSRSRPRGKVVCNDVFDPNKENTLCGT